MWPQVLSLWPAFDRIKSWSSWDRAISPCWPVAGSAPVSLEIMDVIVLGRIWHPGLSISHFCVAGSRRSQLSLMFILIDAAFALIYMELDL